MSPKHHSYPSHPSPRPKWHCCACQTHIFRHQPTCWRLECQHPRCPTCYTFHYPPYHYNAPLPGITENMFLASPPTTPRIRLDDPRIAGRVMREDWLCHVCTFFNPASAPKCGRAECAHPRCENCHPLASFCAPASLSEPPPPIPPRNPARLLQAIEFVEEVVEQSVEVVPIIVVEDTEEAEMSSTETLLNSPISITETLTPPVVRFRVQQHLPQILHMHRPALVPRRFR
ncbi:hypothetical protein BU16DRAFT_566673 [Lophium mytilinum]|uniref:RanBP2-type domain-containing protein n=1 Tax=Lophium mytilinum TaxID=390894 RepID=A0A6A6QER8_9PEZI|nr:hypothetical protein BU16DRAFT_566673 [Lophium mytilinum]